MLSVATATAEGVFTCQHVGLMRPAADMCNRQSEMIMSHAAIEECCVFMGGSELAKTAYCQKKASVWTNHPLLELFGTCLDINCRAFLSARSVVSRDG